MVIDFHTHAFADELAPRAAAALTAKVEGLLDPYHDSTVTGLLGAMDKWGVDMSVVLNIVTKPSQTDKVNAWAASVNSGRLVSFGSVYPDDINYKAAVDRIAELGLKGIKFHCEYQQFFVDGEKYLPLYDYALSKGLIIVFHAGVDLGMPLPFHSDPKRFRRIVRAMQGGDIVLAHLGSHDMWDGVEEYLVGERVYFDTSMGIEYYGPERLERIVKNHGADKVLFASDSPWGDGGAGIRAVEALSVSRKEKDAILYKNALRLLKMD